VNLRPLRWWDIEDITPLERELFPDDPWPAESFWAELSLGAQRCYLVAEDEDGVLGYAGLSCLVDARGADAEIMTVAVAPRAQGRGVGRALLETLRHTAVERGAGRLILEVRADNAAARALYAATGFDEIGTRVGYYRTAGPGSSGPAVDALVLSLPLSIAAAAPDSVQP
jgi:[ribosomal protein S18]-alanine N-acetyltransferase